MNIGDFAKEQARYRMSRQNPNILISGTPGVGKSSLASMIADKSNLTWMNIGDFAKEHGCLGEWDEEYQCNDLDEDKLLDLVEERQTQGGLIIDHHVADIFPERWFDIVFVLRANNTDLYDRLASRGYSGKKLEENVQAEIFQTILDEAKESYREEIVVELQSEVEEHVESNVSRVMMWVEQWKQDRGRVRPGKRRAEGGLEK